MKNLQEVLLNPVRMRIVQHLAFLNSATVTHLSELMSDVPRTTLYRHMNVLLEWEVLTVLNEKQKRGTVEREYTLNNKKMQQTLLQTPAQQSASAFLIQLLSDFERYFQTPQNNAIQDGLFLTENSLLLSDTEFEECTKQVFDVITKYLNYSAKEGRKPRMLSVISSPYHPEDSK